MPAPGIEFPKGPPPDVRLTVRVDFGPERQLGPGKVRLLEAIRDNGSISRGAQQLGMSYRRAWLLVAAMNRCFRDPVVAAQSGGSRGGGAEVTPFGLALIGHYRALEAAAVSAGAGYLQAMVAALRD